MGKLIWTHQPPAHYGEDALPPTVSLTYTIDPNTFTANFTVSMEALQDIVSLIQSYGVNIKIQE